MHHNEAVFWFESDHAGRIYQALQPELADEVNPRSTISCQLEVEHMLVLTVTAQDTSSLRAALNMYLRLINVADEMQEIV